MCKNFEKEGTQREREIQRYTERERKKERMKERESEVGQVYVLKLLMY